MDQERRVKQHTWAGNAPEAWRSCADGLLAASAVLRERREPVDSSSLRLPHSWRLHPIELMLDGMAIECLLKAVWVKRGNELARDGRHIPVPGAGTHDLVQLAAVLQLTFSDHAKDMLRRLSHFIEYGGRYPVPRNADKLQLTQSPGGGRAAATTWATPGDQHHLEIVIRQLNQLLDAT